MGAGACLEGQVPFGFYEPEGDGRRETEIKSGRSPVAQATLRTAAPLLGTLLRDRNFVSACIAPRHIRKETRFSAQRPSSPGARNKH
jgi:hypothetical protein